jgi:hypothetical protein
LISIGMMILYQAGSAPLQWRTGAQRRIMLGAETRAGPSDR